MMKRYFLFILIIFSLTSCQNEIESFDYNQEFWINVNHTALINNGEYTINFDSVFTDSRFPEGTECFWSGVAGARFTLNNSRTINNEIIELYTLNNSEWCDSTETNNLVIRLLALTKPSINDNLVYKNYQAKIIITKN